MVLHDLALFEATDKGIMIIKLGMTPCSRNLLENIIAGLAIDCKNEKGIKIY